MRAAGIGHAGDQVEAESNAAGFSLALELRVRLLQTHLIRHSGRHVGLTVHTLDGHIGIELERPPDNGGLVLRARRYSKVKAALPQIAPRTDRVGIDVDAHMTSWP